MIGHNFFILALFFFFYSLIVSEKVNRSIVAMLGAATYMLLRVIDQKEAIHFIDFNTIGLLLGMMILVDIIKRTGIFEFLAIHLIKLSKGNSFKLLVILAVTTAFLSAILDNVTTVFIIVPITIALAAVAKMNPMPYILMEIFASNIGGTMTLIGDPPNIIIGSAAHLSFLSFINHNFIPVVLVLIFYIAIIYFLFRKSLKINSNVKEILAQFDESKIVKDMVFLKRSLTVFIITIILFMTHSLHGLDPASIALMSAFVLLLVTKVKPEEVFKEVDYVSLFFLVGIFILVGVLEHEHILASVATYISSLTQGSLLGSMVTTLWVSAIASAFLDNIPLTTVFVPIINSMMEVAQIKSQVLWWALSLGACFGGNGSLVGAAANIIVIGIAKKNNIHISFWDFLKIGFPLMIMSLVISTIYLYFRFF